MCQYSCDADNAPGVPNDWHLVHLGSLATGGAALIVAEATAVSPVGRISPRDTGLWNDAQIEGWRRITDFVHAQDNGAKIAVQIAHAGRKASTYPPFAEEGGYVPPERGGWQTLGPTDAAFGNDAAPVAMTEEDINGVIRDFASAAARAVAAGFDRNPRSTRLFTEFVFESVGQYALRCLGAAMRDVCACRWPSLMQCGEKCPTACRC